MIANTPREEVLFLPEVSAYVEVTERTIYRLAVVEKIRAFKVGGVWRSRTTDIDTWINAQSLDSEGMAK